MWVFTQSGLNSVQEVQYTLVCSVNISSCEMYKITCTVTSPHMGDPKEGMQTRKGSELSASIALIISPNIAVIENFRPSRSRNRSWPDLTASSISSFGTRLESSKLWQNVSEFLSLLSSNNKIYRTESKHTDL